MWQAVGAVGTAICAAQMLARRYSSRFDTGRTGAEWAAVLSGRAGLRLRLEPAGNPARGPAAYLPLSRQVVLSREVWEGRDVWAAGAAAHEVGHAVDHAGGGLAGFLLTAADTGPRLLGPAMAGFAAAALVNVPGIFFFGTAAAVAASVLASGLWAFLLAAGAGALLFALGRACMGAAATLSSALAAYLPGIASAVVTFALLGGLPLACLELAGEWRASRWAESALRGGIPAGSAPVLRAALGAALGSHATHGLLWALAAAGMAGVAAGALWSPGSFLGLSAAAVLWLVLLWRHRRLGRERPVTKATLRPRSQTRSFGRPNKSDTARADAGGPSWFSLRGGGYFW